MTLSSLVVSRDWNEVSVLECILGGLHIGVDVESEPERARAKLAKSKIDALIVDCDLDGSKSFLRDLDHGMNTVPLVIIGSKGNRGLHKGADANFIFEKPISVEQAVHTLSAARNLILEGRLRYHRHTLDLPITVTWNTHQRCKASLLNLSHGGVAVRPSQPKDLSGAVQVNFALPGCERKFKIKGEVVWKREGNAGIHFVGMSRKVQQDLQLWLAQQYLTR